MNRKEKGKQTYDILGYHFLLKWDFSEGEQMAQFLYPSCQVYTSEKPEEIYSITSTEKGIDLWKGGKLLGQEKTLEELYSSLEYTITTAALNHLETFCTIHAGGVVYGEDALLLPGEGGSGKTTLVMTLALKGFKPLGDDIILVDTESNSLRAYPRGFLAKGDTGRWLAKNHLKPADMVKVEDFYYLRQNALTPFAEEGRLKYVVFPKYKPAEKPKFTPLGKVEALAKILSSAWVRKGATMNFVRMFKNVQMFSLIYSSREESAELLAQLLTS